VNQARPLGPWAIALPILAVITAMASFQIGAAFAKTLFPAITPQGAAALRLGLGALMLLVLARPWRAWPKQARLWPVIALGASMAGTILLFYLAMSRLPLGVAMALQFLGPLSIAIFGSRKATDLIWAALAAGGVWLLVGLGSEEIKADPIGILYALGAAACWAGYIVFGRAASKTFGQSAATLGVGLAAILVLPVGVYQAGPALFAAEHLPMALLMAVFSSAIPFTLEFFAMPRMPARTFAVFMSLEPAFGVLFGLLMLHEVLALTQLAGVALVIIAAGGAAWSSSRPTADPPPAT
jgi:inner membrane transporter RhtA